MQSIPLSMTLRGTMESLSGWQGLPRSSSREQHAIEFSKAGYAFHENNRTIAC